MKLSSGDPIVFIVIAIVVAIAKGIGKLSQSSGENESATPAPTPRPRAKTPRPIQNRRPVVVQPTPPVVREKEAEYREGPPRDLREFMERLSRPAVPPPIVHKAAPPVPVKPAPVEQTVAPAVAATKAPSTSAKEAPVAPWISALRDRKNLRNIIIANEIIGPPRGA